MMGKTAETESSSADEDSGRLTTTGKGSVVPSAHPAERAAVAAEMYGLVVKIWPSHCHFYASADFYGSHRAVIEQAKTIDGFEIFLCRPSENENGFLLEPVEGDWEELITGDTSVEITPKVLLWRQEEAKRSLFTHYHFDDRPRDGETFAHFIAETALFVSEDERRKIPFHLFSREILSLRDIAGCSVAVVMAANDVFPPEMLSDDNIGTDPQVPFYLLFYSRTDGGDVDGFDRKPDEKILTKERLVNPLNAGDRWSGTGLAIPAALSGRIPESLRYAPDILQIKAWVGWSVLEILIENDPDYIRSFPVESMAPEVLGTEVNLYLEREHGYRGRPLRDILAEAGIFPGDETEAMFWLIGDDEKRVRTAERFYRVEYPELYEETIRFIREIHLKHLKAAEISEEPDFTERYIL